MQLFVLLPSLVLVALVAVDVVRRSGRGVRTIAGLPAALWPVGLAVLSVIDSVIPLYLGYSSSSSETRNGVVVASSETVVGVGLFTVAGAIAYAVVRRRGPQPAR